MVPKLLIAYSKNLSSNFFRKILSKSPINKPLTPSCFLKALLKSWSVSHFVAKTFLNGNLSQCLMKRLSEFHLGLGWGISQLHFFNKWQYLSLLSLKEQSQYKQISNYRIVLVEILIEQGHHIAFHFMLVLLTKGIMFSMYIIMNFCEVNVSNTYYSRVIFVKSFNS